MRTMFISIFDKHVYIYVCIYGCMRICTRPCTHVYILNLILICITFLLACICIFTRYSDDIPIFPVVFVWYSKLNS